MNYKKALKLLHTAINPDKYVEIGVAHGQSLDISKCKSIGVDPAPHKMFENDRQKKVYKLTSDDFFSSYNLSELLDGPFDLAFIDGMHLVENVLRDFINLEKHSHMASYILIDDVLPDDMSWASRRRKRKEWTGDVYRAIYILKKYRPDLDIKIFSVDLKGLAVITNLNKYSTHLEQNYKEIELDIQNGKYVVQNRDDLEHAFQPISPSELQEWIYVKEMELSKRRYLDLLKSTLTNEIYADNDLRINYLMECIHKERKFNFDIFHDISNKLKDEYQMMLEVKRTGRLYDRKIEKAGFSHSMIGLIRMSGLISCLDIIRKNRIEGTLIECGVWRGGASIMIAAYNKIYNLNKKVFVADSFEGLPRSTYKEDLSLDLSKDKYPELAVSLETVKESFKKYNLLTDDIIFLKGWFKDTLYNLDEDLQISLLRLDGDLYESTINTLDALYDKVTQGGIIIVDDFGLTNCRKAVLDFFDQRRMELPDFHEIDWTGIFWIKR